MAEETNNVQEQLKPTNKFATTFTKVTSVVLGALTAAAAFNSVKCAKEGDHGFSALYGLAALVSAVSASTAWDSARGATEARNFSDRITKSLAVNKELGNYKS